METDSAAGNIKWRLTVYGVQHETETDSTAGNMKQRLTARRAP